MISNRAIYRGLLLLFGPISLATAHDFWLQPTQYWAGPAASTPFTLQVGHGPYAQRSPIPARRVMRFDDAGPDRAIVDLKPGLAIGGAVDDGSFRLQTPGTHVLLLQTDANAQTHLPSIRFNDYLKAEGLTPALDERARRHRMEADGSERYSRCAKSIVQVGPFVAAAPDAASTPFGLTLEIVPESNPYRIPRPTTFPVQVIYEGHPLADALIKLTDLDNDAAPFETHLTDQDGRASFAMPTSGTWLINVIWTKALPPSEETDFETVFSSLSFGFPPAAR